MKLPKNKTVQITQAQITYAADNGYYQSPKSASHCPMAAALRKTGFHGALVGGSTIYYRNDLYMPCTQQMKQFIHDFLHKTAKPMQFMTNWRPRRPRVIKI